MEREPKPKRRPVKVNELLAELAADPEYQVRRRMQEDDLRVRNEAAGRNAELIRRALSDVGLQVGDLTEVKSFNDEQYRRAIPVLARFLAAAPDGPRKSGLASLFGSPHAGGAGSILIEEFKALPEDSIAKWKIADSLSECARSEDFDGIANLLRDKKHGKAREMLALALGRIPTPASIELLIELLDDKEIGGHAVIGLGRLRAREAVSALHRMLKHRKPWVRHEAMKAIQSIGS